LTLTKAGQSEILPDQSSATTIGDMSSAVQAVESAISSVDAHVDYVPGDVVEFDGDGEVCSGILYRWGSRLAIVAKWKYDTKYEYDYQSFYNEAMKTARKIGHIDLQGESDTDAVKEIAKAYFTKTSKEIKVGDKVRATDKEDTGNVYELRRSDEGYDWWDVKKDKWNSKRHWSSQEAAIACYRDIYKMSINLEPVK